MFQGRGIELINLRELLITAVILAPCAREFLGVGADVAEVISGAEPGRIGLSRAEPGIIGYRGKPLLEVLPR